MVYHHIRVGNNELTATQILQEKVGDSVIIIKRGELAVTDSQLQKLNSVNLKYEYVKKVS
ncbi:MAG: hypothetical protein R2685_10950 [Candidatus Nitrosocosmicus sp.]|nr:hypothetical protein [Candidatus Nitrosocosmicus sp.]